MKKSMLVLALYALVSLSFSPITAEEENEVTTGNDVVDNNRELTEYSNLVVPEEIVLDYLNNSIQLFVEYDNVEDALINFELKHHDLLSAIKVEYALEEFNLQTSLEYYDCFLEYQSSNSEISDETFSDFRRFFDILEGQIRNQEIVELVSQLNNQDNSDIKKISSFVSLSGDMLAEEELANFEVLATIVPSYNSLSTEFNEIVREQIIPLDEIKSSSSGITTFGLSGNAKTKAINYAAKHATNYNNANYHPFSADCTNFASQILEAAGVSQSVYASEHSGWWHKTTKHYMSVDPYYYYTHTHSVSWIRADTFARYMGIGKKAYNIRQLGDMVVSGDFIAADWTGNGSWDHIAFITAADNYYGTYTSKTGKSYYYMDFKVAQHTRNYNAWTSTNTQDWETFETGQVVALVRR